MIVLHAEGQTCNKFFIYLGFMADSIESGEKIIILSPDVSIKHYTNLQQTSKLKFPFYNERVANFFGYNNYINLLRIFWGNKFSQRLLSLFFKLIPGVNFVIASSGSHKTNNHRKYAVELKKRFEPNSNVIEDVFSVFKESRTKSEIICGIHIRYGDYKTYKGGRYYYSLEQYHALMLNIKKLFSNKTVTFFISSNENIDLSVFTGCNCFTIPNSNPTKDLYGLGISDYIIGPPSTFSGWASYFENKPLYFIENPNEEIKLSSFKNILEIWS